MVDRIAALALVLGASALPAAAAPAGALTTLPAGNYVCEKPGDAAGPVGHRLPDAGFTVLNASSYAANGARGTYLATNGTVTMTSGPHRGQTFDRRSEGHLVRVDPASSQRIRCVRSNRNNSPPGERG